MDDRHPALARLDALVGRWTVEPKVDGLGASWTEFAWVEGGKFLRQHSDSDPLPDTAPAAWHENNPLPSTAFIGLDDAGDTFTMLYADRRGVHRAYQMTFDGRVWTTRRAAPGFHQRFAATLSPDGRVIDGETEMSTDGETWRLDFGIRYTRDDA